MVEADGLGGGGWRGGVSGLWVLGGMVTVSNKQHYTFADGLLIGCVAGGGIVAAVFAGVGWMVMG